MILSYQLLEQPGLQVTHCLAVVFFLFFFLKSKFFYQFSTIIVNVLLEYASWLWDVCSIVGNVLLVTATERSAECGPACLLATSAFQIQRECGQDFGENHHLYSFVLEAFVRIIFLGAFPGGALQSSSSVDAWFCALCLVDERRRVCSCQVFTSCILDRSRLACAIRGTSTIL